MANINKNQIGYNEVVSAGTANALMVQYKRANAAPIDITEIFTSISAAVEYAKSGPTAYAGQVIAVAGEDIRTTVYTITSAGTLTRLVDENDLNEVVSSAGKIDEIKVNGSALTITDKSVNIDLGGYVTTDTLSSIVSDDTGKTIREIANEELVSVLITEDAKESLDTLEEIASWIQSHPDDVTAMNLSINDLKNSAHSHTNKSILDNITEEKITDWDSHQQYTDNAISGLSEVYDIKGSSESAITISKEYVNEKIDELVNVYDAKGSSLSALTEAKTYSDETLNSAKAYVNGKVDGKFDAIGSASSALTEAKAYADSKVDGKFDAIGSASSALTEAKAYADSLATNYDSVGSASSALTEAKTYADSLATNYDSAGSASSALTAAKTYADSLAKNYDLAGSANAALSSAKAYVNGKIDGKFDAIGSASSALTEAKAYVDSTIEGYATKSYVTEQIVSAMTGGEIELTGYAKVEDVKASGNTIYASAKTYTDSAIITASEDLNWILVEGEKQKVRNWRGTRANYEMLVQNDAVSPWTRYVVIDTINGKEVITEYYGNNQVADATGQLLPVKDIIGNISDITPQPYDRYLVGSDGKGYQIYEYVIDGEFHKWLIKPFDYRYGVRVIEKGLKNYVYVSGILKTYDDVDCGSF